MDRKMMQYITVGLVAIVLVASVYVVVTLREGPSGDDNDDESYLVNVTDMLGRSVDVNVSGIERVVAVGAGALRFVVYMGAVDKVVGVEEMESDDAGYIGRTYFTANFDKLNGSTSIGPSFGGDMESISGVNPDVVFTAGLTIEQCNTYQTNLGIPVIALSQSIGLTTHWDEFCDQLTLMGQVLNNSERADGVIDFIESVTNDISSRVANDTSGEDTEAYIGGISYGGHHGIFYTTTDYDPFVLANITNVVSNLENGTAGDIGSEGLISYDPEVIFVDSGGMSFAQNDYNTYGSLLEDITAFENDEVYRVLTTNWYATNYDTVLVDSYYVASVIHPDQFSDVNITTKANEIYTYLLGSSVYDEMVAFYGELGPLSFS